MKPRTKTQIDNYLGGFLHAKNIFPGEKKEIGAMIDGGNYKKKEQFLESIQRKHHKRVHG